MTVLSPTTPARGELAQRLTNLATQALARGLDPQAAAHLALLQEKVQAEPCTVALCGHFSAGKSTLINTLAGAPVLPASPIPTSANRVTIRHGAAGATVRMRSGADLELPTDELNRLSAYCVDGDAVAAVAVRYPLQHVPETLWLMDTPGIDSTDDAHRVATESALYLADVVFYVMDYNHVQSEVNFQFTRELVQWGKPLYLIINQVDKHVELELPFAAFRQSVIDAFAAWDVQPQDIFFTSLREQTHPLNEFPRLLETMAALGGQAEGLLLAGVWNSSRHLMAELDRHDLETAGEQRAELAALAGAGGDLAALAQERAAAVAAPQALEDSLRKQLDFLNKNAPLVPYQTRELVQAYLESRTPGFKVGFLFAGAKTEQEIARRLAAWHGALQANLQAQLVYHVKELLLHTANAHGLVDDALRTAVAALQADLPADWLAAQVMITSAGDSHYLLKYVLDTTAEAQSRVRRLAEPLVLDLRSRADAHAAQRLAALDGALAERQEAVAAQQALAALTAAAASRTAAWQATLGAAPALPALPVVGGGYAAAAAQGGTALAAGAATGVAAALLGAGGGQAAAVGSGVADGQGGAGLALLHQTAANLRQTADLVAELTGLAQAAADLRERAGRLDESRFTVALFGAFSAGKSSFANALMGAHVLPVSPNPTTAVITRVLPPSPTLGHGQVHVTWKTPAALADEVRQAVAALGLSASGQVAKDLKAAAGVRPEDLLPGAKPHAAFLRAAALGFQETQPKLGTAEVVDLARFAALVAEERLACFVQEMALAFDCPLTRAGITLVDTPGADSINARHTGVAFDYIKNADAILFVTYYNHAFAAPDREFLIQLGRVKDAFALDKMFFVVNAADLAASPTELEGVLQHVRRNLLSCGIQSPRLFPVSSQTALWSRLWAAGQLPASLVPRLQGRLGPEATPAQGVTVSGLQVFEDAFYQFTVTDLSQMAAAAAIAELRRVQETVQGWHQEAQADSGAKAVRAAALQAAGQRAMAAARALPVATELGAVQAEADTLLFHLRQKVLLRYREQFPEAFHPSVLRKDHPNLKRALQDCLREIMQFVCFDLNQQLRSTGLYLEKGMQTQAAQIQQRLQAAVAAQAEGLRLPAFRPEPVTAPETFDVERHLALEPFAPLLKLFKSPEQFFAGGGRHELRDALQQALEPALTAATLSACGVLVQTYTQALQARADALRALAAAEVAAQVQGLLATLQDQAQAARLAQVAGALAAVS